MLNGCNLFEHGARNAPWHNEDLKWYEVWLIRFCVLYIHTFHFFPKKESREKRININVWQSFSCEKVGAQRVQDCRHVVRFSDFCCQRISRIPSATAAPRNDPGWIFASFGWRLVCRGLAQSIKLPVVGILYLSSWNFAFVLLVFCILSSSPSWGLSYVRCTWSAKLMRKWWPEMAHRDIYGWTM